jgi:precorrin-6Y C5,15-methyltransferase (decarboxylating)
VTLGSEAQLLTRHAALGGKLIRIAISRADPIGEKTGWHAAMPVTQWIWTKP